VDVSKPKRLVGLAIDAAVALAFGCVLIGAGHGAGPIGLVMLAGSPEAWGFPTTVGWVGIALLAISVSFPRRGLYLSLTLVGLAMVVASWWLFISPSSSLEWSLVYSIPFLSVLAYRLYLIVQLGRGSAAP
jgi:hypothetical protein